MTTALALDDPKKLCQQLADVAQQCVEQARASGASGAEAGVSTSAGLSVTARNGEVETIEHIRDKGVGLTVYFGQRKGTASTSDSWTREKPSIDEPSNVMPSSSAFSSSAGLIAKLFRLPSTSVNHRRTSRTPRSSTVRRT